MVSARISVFCGLLTTLILLVEFPQALSAGRGCPCRGSSNGAPRRRCLLVCGSVPTSNGRVLTLPVKRLPGQEQISEDLLNSDRNDFDILRYVLDAALHRRGSTNTDRMSGMDVQPNDIDERFFIDQYSA